MKKIGFKHYEDDEDYWDDDYVDIPDYNSVEYHKVESTDQHYTEEDISDWKPSDEVKTYRLFGIKILTITTNYLD